MKGEKMGKQTRTRKIFKVDEEKFNSIIALKGHNLTMVAVAKATGVSAATVGNIWRFDNYTDFAAARDEASTKAREKREDAQKPDEKQMKLTDCINTKVMVSVPTPDDVDIIIKLAERLGCDVEVEIPKAKKEAKKSFWGWKKNV